MTPIRFHQALAMLPWLALATAIVGADQLTKAQVLAALGHGSSPNVHFKKLDRGQGLVSEFFPLSLNSVKRGWI